MGLGRDFVVVFFSLEFIESSNPSLPKGNKTIVWQCDAALLISRHRELLPFVLVTLFRSAGKKITQSVTQEATVAITSASCFLNPGLAGGSLDFLTCQKR